MKQTATIEFSVPGASNAVGTADDFFDLAQVAAREGNHEAAEFMLNKAVEAETGGNANMFVDGIPEDGNPRSLGDPIWKAVAGNSMRPDPTPLRFNETLEVLGFYNGVKDVSDITGHTFAFERTCAQNPIVHSVISTRATRAQQYAVRSRNNEEKGFKIRSRSDSAPDTKATRRRIEELEQIIQYGGFMYDSQGRLNKNPVTGQPGVWDGKGEERALSFAETIVKMVTYSMIHDFAPMRFEPLRDKKTYPIGWMKPVDPRYVRPVTKQYRPQIDKNLKHVSHVEMHPSNPQRVIREFSWETMDVLIRNPDLTRVGRGFGHSPLLILLEVIASIILGFNYQKSYFDDSNIPPGIVTMNGMPARMGTQVIEFLRQQIERNISAGTPHKLLYLMFPKDVPNPLNVIPLKQQIGTVQEMGFIKDWYVMLVSMVCMVFQMQPEEIGWEGVSTKNTTLNEGTKDGQFMNSDIKGFRPLMQSLENFFSQSIVQRIDPDFVLEFVGVEPSDATDPQRVQMLLSQGVTPNQIQEMKGMPMIKVPLESDLYDRIKKQLDEDEDHLFGDDYDAEIKAVYEDVCEQYGLKAYSDYPDMPIGNISAFQWMAQEKQQNQENKTSGNITDEAPLPSVFAIGANGDEQAEAGGMMDGEQQGQPDMAGMDESGMDPNAMAQMQAAQAQPQQPQAM